MDQYTPRDDANGSFSSQEAVGGEASPWGQPEQAVTPDPTQAASGSGQEAAAEYAAWSTDTSYQAQAYAAQQAATPAYPAPEPQSATYSDQQAYGQQQAYYDQSAYAQQQWQQPQQQSYDQAAYQQQQQAYAQQGYAQQPQQPQQQYYDQAAYGQQPSYYDQQAYAQQWQSYQQPTQPYAYAQPGQQPWPGDAQYWDQSAGGYGRSFLAVLAGFVLLAWGVVFGLAGAFVMWRGNLDQVIAGLDLTPEALALVTEFNKQATAYGAILLIIGIVQLIGGVGILAHRTWGRAFAIVLGLIGTIWGVALVLSSGRFDVGDLSVKGVLAGQEPALAFAIIVLVCYLLIFLAMFVGKRHFRRKGVS